MASPSKRQRLVSDSFIDLSTQPDIKGPAAFRDSWTARPLQTCPPSLAKCISSGGDDDTAGDDVVCAGSGTDKGIDEGGALNDTVFFGMQNADEEHEQQVPRVDRL